MADKVDKLHPMRHSLAHIMATAIQEMWPEAKFGVGPVIENGFYYDVDLGQPLAPEDLKRIEKKMREVIRKDYPFERFELPIEEAIAKVKAAGQDYKVDLLNDLKQHGTTNLKDIDPATLGASTGSASKADRGQRSADSEKEAVSGQRSADRVSFYRDGPFEDLCRGPHVASTGKVGAFKLTKVSGAYWRGDQSKAQLQRIYGVAFATKEELDAYFTMLAEAERRDHRKLGQELDLFTFSDLVGPGLPLWTPRGTVLRNQLDKFVQDMRDEYDYQEVTVPHITKKDAYIKSGHWAKFADELFRITSREGHEFAMKPMNCPHHTQIYASRPRSYRDLPLRYRETTMCYRDEQTGELSGLSRLRSFTQDDAHVFCRTNQIEAEALKVWDIIERFYGAFDFSLRVRFSRHDPANMAGYSGKESDWKSAEAQMKKIIESKVGQEYADGLGEAAFYGPKIDFMAKDAIGREHQVATIQLDFNQPEGFDLTCTNEQGESERIVMIHAAIMGSIERFLSVYIEHSAGKFPVWLAPEQVRVATVNDSKELTKLAEKIRLQMKAAGVRGTVDISNESVGKKIRAAEMWKVPYTLVVGEQELKHGVVTPRVRGDLAVGESQPMEIADFIKSVANESVSRASRSSL
jgi:threonyl-tRNA synthetase